MERAFDWGQYCAVQLEHARFSKHSGHAGSLNLPVFKKAKYTAYDFFAEKFRMAKS